MHFSFFAEKSSTEILGQPYFALFQHSSARIDKKAHSGGFPFCPFSGILMVLNTRGKGLGRLCDRRFLSTEGARRVAEVLAGCIFRPMAVNRFSPARVYLV